MLSDAFILALDRNGGHPVRLAGTRVCALFGREIKGEPFVDFWAAASGRSWKGLLSHSCRRMHRHGCRSNGTENDGKSIDLELLLLPLGIRRPSFARTIGVLAPLKVPPWLGATPVGALTIGGRRHIGAELEKRLLPRFMAPRGRRGLMVYDGGRVEPARTGNKDGPSAA